MSRVKSLPVRAKGRAGTGAPWAKACGVYGKLPDGFALRLRLALQNLSARLAAYSSSRRPEFLEIPALALPATSAPRRKG